jgi:uncharacterized Zn-binding protein involved in type VI secretion
MPAAARLGDMHTCPMVTPPPHQGGPILSPCEPTVKVGGQPQARVGDLAQCDGPPDTIVKGSSTVLVGGQMAAREGDPTAHGGVIRKGEPTVIIGDGSGAVACKCMKTAAAEAKALVSGGPGVFA